MIDRYTDNHAEEASPEVTLGLGKLLALFFALVILCGLSLGIGYSIGRNSAKKSSGEASSVSAPASTTAPDGPAKPAAGASTPPADSDTAPSSGQQAAATDNMTFYDSVKEKNPQAKLTPAPAHEAPREVTHEPREPVRVPAAKSAAPKPSAAGRAVSAKATASSKATLGSGYVIQIAAVSKQEDAETLRVTLARQHYPASIMRPTSDRLYHIQVGPYADQKQASAMRDRLRNAGFGNAFLKH